MKVVNRFVCHVVVARMHKQSLNHCLKSNFNNEVHTDKLPDILIVVTMTIFSKAFDRFKKLKKNRTLSYGVPFVAFLIIGSFGVERFASLRYEFRQTKLVASDELEKPKRKKVSLEEEYESYKKLDIDSWENIRGPRPWEETDQTSKKPLSQ